MSFPGSASHKAQTGLAYDGDDNDYANFGNSGDDDGGSGGEGDDDGSGGDDDSIGGGDW